jgi:protein-disulfide isomerase/uncharacterized membrane protein
MNSSSSENKQVLRWTAALLALVGLGLATELTRIHVRLLTEPNHQSFCNVSATVNCDAVAQSSYSMLLGLPLSVWGVFGYSAALVVAVWLLRGGGRAAAASLWIIAAVCTVSAIVLATISALVLRTWCLLCVASWVVDIGLFAVAFFLNRPDGVGAGFADLVAWIRENSKVAAGWAVLGTLALVLSYRTYHGSYDAGHSTVARSASPAGSSRAHEGTDEHGLPYVGAVQPKLVITEFSDYQCPHCAKSHEQLRLLVETYPDAVRVVHRHFPLDNDCNPLIKQVFHTHACYYARLAICAASLGKFWVGNDFLFKHGQTETSVPIDAFARAISAPPDMVRECLKSQADAQLKLDVDAGLKLEIDGTPTFVIRGRKYTGALPEAVLREFPLKP